MKKQQLYSSISLIALSVLLTACGGDGGSGTAATPEQQRINAALQKAKEADAAQRAAEEQLHADQKALEAAKATGDPEKIKAAEEAERKSREDLEAKARAAAAAKLAKEQAESDAAANAAAEALEKARLLAAQAAKEQVELAERRLLTLEDRIKRVEAQFETMQEPTSEDIKNFRKNFLTITAQLKPLLASIQPIELKDEIAPNTLHQAQLKAKWGEAQAVLTKHHPISKLDTVADIEASREAINTLLRNTTAAMKEEANLYSELEEILTGTDTAINEYNATIAKISTQVENYAATQEAHYKSVDALLNQKDGDDRLQKGLITAVTGYATDERLPAVDDDHQKVIIQAKKLFSDRDEPRKTTVLNSFNTELPKLKDAILLGDRKAVINKLLHAVNKHHPDHKDAVYKEGFHSPLVVTNSDQANLLDQIFNAGTDLLNWFTGEKTSTTIHAGSTQMNLDDISMHQVSFSPTHKGIVAKVIKGEKIEEITKNENNEEIVPHWKITFKYGVGSRTAEKEFYKRATYDRSTRTATFDENGDILAQKLENGTYSILESGFISGWVDMFEADGKRETLYGKAIAELLDIYLKEHDLFKLFWNDTIPVPASDSAKRNSSRPLSATTFADMTSAESFRKARFENGGVDLSRFKLNGASGQSIELGLPLFVQLKGDVSSAKSTEAATGSVTYRLGNTVIGAIQGYANSGAGFEADSRQLETSVVASHSFGSFFVEGQIGSVSANDVYISNWSGYRSQITVGLDTEFVSPFVQVTHRQLDRDGFDLNETTGYVGLDMDIAKLAADTYSIGTRLLAKAGYGSKNWSSNSNDLGSTTGFSGSVEWSASLNLNSGVSFSSNLSLDTLAGSSAAVNVSLDR